ncbi:MAG: SDR family NAD(P)-dependent oxidoreductase [Chitinophagaceae bacterium]
MKTAIITGSTGNLGKAVAHKFIKEGYRVVGTVTHKDDATTEFPTDSFEGVAVDVENEEDAKNFVEKTFSKYGAIDVAVITVGGFAKGTVAETKTTEIINQYRLNFETAYNIAQPVFVQMMQQGNGRIFLIGSRPGIDAKYSKGMVAYGLAKSLIFRLAELMNDEAKGHNVVTSVVVPSTIDTEVNRTFMPEADFNSWVKAEEIAGTIYFYCTDAAAALREPVIKAYNNS